MSATANSRCRASGAAADTSGPDAAATPLPADADERLRAFAETAGLWLWELNHNLRFRFVSPGWRELTGMEPLGLTPWEVWNRFASDDRQWRRLRESLEAGRPLDGLRLIVAGDGGERHLEVRGRPFLDEEGRFAGYRGSMTDVTAQVEAERRAVTAQRVLVDAIENMPVGVVLWSPEGELMLCNSRYLDLFPAGARPGPDFGRPGEARELEVDGRWVQIRHHRMDDGCVVGIYTDVTELRTAKEQAEQANRAKSRFLAAASHDIRQPLQGMGLFVAALARTELPPAARGLVEKLALSLESLESLLTSLLDISRLEAGVIEPEPGPVPLGPMLRRLVEEFTPVAADKGIGLKLVPTSVTACSDTLLLERILRNLIANAIRYTDEGGVLVGCRRRGAEARIEVWDTGIGIPREHQREIFREFRRLSGNGRGPGAGLGLAIVERAAALLGHSVRVRSWEGRGSVFSVTVPRLGGHGPIKSPESPSVISASSTKVEVE